MLRPLPRWPHNQPHSIATSDTTAVETPTRLSNPPPRPLVPRRSSASHPNSPIRHPTSIARVRPTAIALAAQPPTGSQINNLPHSVLRFQPCDDQLNLIPELTAVKIYEPTNTLDDKSLSLSARQLPACISNQLRFNKPHHLYGNSYDRTPFDHCPQDSETPYNLLYSATLAPKACPSVDQSPESDTLSRPQPSRRIVFISTSYHGHRRTS
jgi:hypothetical protein